MKTTKTTLIAGIVAITALLTSCKKEYDYSNVDRIDLVMNTITAGVKDTTYLNLKSKLPINTSNYNTADLIYKTVSANEVNVKVPTDKANTFFQFDWLISGGNVAHFGIYKKSESVSVKWGD
jgi:hypothetical protein